MNMVVKWDFALLIFHKWRVFKVVGNSVRPGLNIIFEPVRKDCFR